MALTWQGGAAPAIPYVQTGIVMTLYPTFDVITGLPVVDEVEVRRAPDAAGSPGTAETITRLPAVPSRGKVFFDPRPLNGAVWWYSHRHVRSGGSITGAWSDWQAFIAQAITPGDSRFDDTPGNNASTTNTSTRYRCLAFKAVAANINNATPTALPLDSESWDVGNMHDTVTNNSRITIPAVNNRGVWLFRGGVEFDPNATGYRWVEIVKQGTPGPSQNIVIVPAANFGITQVVEVNTFFVDPLPGTYFELYATQTSGGALGVRGNLNVVHLW